MFKLIKTTALTTLSALTVMAALGTTAHAQSFGALTDIAKSTATDKASSSLGGSAFGGSLLGGTTNSSNSLGGLSSVVGGSNSLGGLSSVVGGSNSLGGLGSVAGGSVLGGSALGSVTGGSNLGGLAGNAAGSLSNTEKLTAGRILLGGGSQSDVAVAVGKSRAKTAIQGRAGGFIN